MAFFTSSTGQPITGDATRAFVQDFTVIPNNTMALAKITKFEMIETKNDYVGEDKFYQVTWKITDGDFVSREVVQKIKCFNGNPQQLDRAREMLMLLMKTCNYQHTTQDAPTASEVARMVGSMAGIKIREWSMPKKDGSGVMEGNFVSEIHSAQGFKSEVGVKMEPVRKTPVDSALSRNMHTRGEPDISDDLPF